MNEMLTLETLLLVPLILSGAAFFLPHTIVRRTTFALSLIPLLLLIIGNFDWIGQKLDIPWFQPLNVHFRLGVDNLTYIFLLLTAIIIPISLVATKIHDGSYFALIFLTEALLFAFFMSRDLAFFTLFYEAMLIPLYFIISIWGGENRGRAALRFIVYMVAGSALMILAVLSIYFATGSLNLDTLSEQTSWILFAIFLLAFAVKTPLFPFHAWLPDTYVEAPVGGTILLSALLSKAGIYGIIRILIEHFPSLMVIASPYLVPLAVIGVFYAGFAAWRQTDYKRLMAYSSLSHVNFILVGLFVMSKYGHEGAILQSINHAVTIAGLFLVAGWLEHKIGTRQIGRVSGLAKFLPYLCWLTLFFVLASVALPGTNNFVGELITFVGVYQYNYWIAAILVLSVILSALYMLRFMQKTYFEEPLFFKDPWIDIGLKEYVIAAPLLFLVLWIGIYPTPVLEQIETYLAKVEKSS